MGWARIVSAAVDVGNPLVGRQLVNRAPKRLEVKALIGRRCCSVNQGRGSSSSQAHWPIAASGGKVEVVLVSMLSMKSTRGGIKQEKDIKKSNGAL